MSKNTAWQSKFQNSMHITPPLEGKCGDHAAMALRGPFTRACLGGLDRQPLHLWICCTFTPELRVPPGCSEPMVKTSLFCLGNLWFEVSPLAWPKHSQNCSVAGRALPSPPSSSPVHFHRCRTQSGLQSSSDIPVPFSLPKSFPPNLLHIYFCFAISYSKDPNMVPKTPNY